MKKLQILLSMTMLLLAMTGCGSGSDGDSSTTTQEEASQVEETTTDEGDATPDEGETTPDESETAPDEEETAPDEGETAPDEEEEATGDFEQLALPESGESIATIKVTGFGEIKLKFFPDKAPLAVENFLTHAENGYYDGIIFHRVINDFMIQGGDPTGTGMGGTSIWDGVFDNEDDADLYHFNGAISMANAGVNTNGSQFFIVNSSPTFPGSSMRGSYSDYAKNIYTTMGGTPFLDGGYTVFGQVYEGLDIVQSIMQVQTTGAEGSTPVENVVIESITVSKY